MQMKQQGNTTVTGGIRGNNNRVTTKNVQVNKVTNNNGGRGGNGGGTDGEAVAVLAVIFIVMVVAVYFYLRHHEQIFLWLKVGAVTVGAIHVSTLIPQYRYADFDLPDTLFTGFGVVLVTIQMLLIGTIEVALPENVLRIASQSTVGTGFVAAAIEVWKRFNSLGHHLIVENLGATVLLASGLFLNLLCGIKCLSDGFIKSDEIAFCEWLSEKLNSVKIAGGLVSVLFTFGGFALVSGFLTLGTN